MLDIQTVSRECVALTVHRAVSSPAEAAELVRGALSRRGLDEWQRMEVEVFPAGGDSLILARPAGEVVHIRVADWLIELLG